MTQKRRIVRLIGNVANAALSMLEQIFEPRETPRHYQTYSVREDTSASEKTAALKALFETDAFKNALPSAQRSMIDGINKVYRR